MMLSITIAVPADLRPGVEWAAANLRGQRTVLVATGRAGRTKLLPPTTTGQAADSSRTRKLALARAAPERWALPREIPAALDAVTEKVRATLAELAQQEKQGVEPGDFFAASLEGPSREFSESPASVSCQSCEAFLRAILRLLQSTAPCLNANLKGATAFSCVEGRDEKVRPTGDN